ncbi:hypothetical protein IMZ31_24340 (plasmid) [Pontibacillus sp. ALD_SL1]|uniref:hypothetical protein n=1 Tax=Pontibacillus sp. ALD_SL1 TaxID=2777185 RepID=UPI001A961974|nr:hypothetical protein [Pontibacillus sp. ALD_SL1]QST02583.1 hypothetical protein IMZ31_24340 [Pontibacillus sp. ALD_SL1]
MKESKWIKPLVLSAAATAATAVAGIALTKGGKDSEGANEVISSVVPEEETFGGLTLEKINEIVELTHRGVKAVIVDGTLEYTFSSASGKQYPTARIEIDEAGELIFTFLSYATAHSPRIFMKNLKEAIHTAD